MNSFLVCKKESFRFENLYLLFDSLISSRVLLKTIKFNHLTPTLKYYCACILNNHYIPSSVNKFYFEAFYICVREKQLEYCYWNVLV